MGHSRASLKTLSTLPRSKGSFLLVPVQGRVGRNRFKMRPSTKPFKLENFCRNKDLAIKRFQKDVLIPFY